MNFWIESYTVLLECIYTFYFFHRLMQPRYPAPWKIAGACILYYGVFLYGSLSLPMLPRIVIMWLLLLLIYSGLLKQSCLKTLYGAVLFFVMAAFADLLSGAILTLMGISMQECLGIGMGRFLYNTTAKILHFLLLAAFLAATERRYDSRALRRATPLILCNAASFFIMAAQFESFIASEDYTPFIISTVAVLFINVIVCVYTETEKHFYALRERQRLMEQQLEYQEKYYRNAILEQEESRALWHDIKKYLLAMETLVADSRSAEAGEQLSAFKQRLKPMEQTIHTGNKMVDGILNYGMQKATAAHVRIEPDLWIDSTLRFPMADFYIILGNTIDNAIEACSALPAPDDALIHLVLRQKNHTLLYEISNPIPASPVEKTGKIHGYGLENVKECVRRNQGSISIDTEQELFRVTVTLNV